MKGIILNLVEEAVVSDHGEAAWDEVLTRAGIDGTYTSLGNYPDEELPRLVMAGAEALSVQPYDLTVHLGRRAIIGLARRYPQFFRPHQGTREFLLTLNDVIHPEVRKLDPDAEPPQFWFDPDEEGRADDPDPSGALVVHYQSKRHLCTLAAGMMQGAGEQYGERVTVVRTACLDDGDDHCTFRCTFLRSVEGG